MAPPNVIDLVSPEPEERPKIEPIDLTADDDSDDEVPVRKPAPSSIGRSDRQSLSGSMPSVSSSIKATSNRPHISSVSRSTPSASNNATAFSRRSALEGRNSGFPAIKDSPKSSQPTRKDTSDTAPKPRFKAFSPVPDGYRSNKFPNLVGLERKQSLPSPASRKPQIERVRNGNDSNGAGPEVSRPRLDISPPQPKEARPEPRFEPETTIPQRKSIAPEPKQYKPIITEPQSKEAQRASSPETTHSQPKESQPESPHSTSRSQRTSIAIELEQPKRKILQPKSRLSQPANRVPTRLANFLSPSSDEDTDRELISRKSTPSEGSKERRRFASGSGLDVGGSSSRLETPSKPSSRVRTPVDSYNLKVLSGTAPRKHVQSAGVSRQNSIIANDSPANLDVEVEKVLLSLKNDMDTNHAVNVRVLLEDASEAVFKAQVETRFMDEVSPFSSMKSIENSLVPARASNLHTFKTVNSDKKTKSSAATSYTMSKRIVSDYVPIPRYTSLTFFRRNVLSPDDENLRSMPQENEQTKKGKALEEELKKAYSYHQKNETSCEIEYRKRLDGIIDVWIEEGDIQCTRHDLEKYLITRKVFGRHLKEKQKSLMEAYKKASSLIAKLKTQLDEEVCQVCGSFDIAFKSVFDIPLHEVLLPTKRMKELLDLELYRTSRQSLDHLQPATRGPMFAVETYTTLNCLICGALDCQTHGEFSEVINYNNENDKDEKEINFLTKPERITLQVDDLLRNHSERQANMDETESGNDTQRTRDPCSPNCHLVVGVGGEATRPLEDSDIRDISLIDRQRRENMQIDIVPPPPLSKAEIEKHRPIWYDNIKKTLKGDWQEMTTMHQQEKMTQANPCHHAGPCSNDTSCECFSKSVLCEDMCSCSDDCPRRFTGCSCRANGRCCERDSCICIQLNRECGPHCDCGALERLNPANRYNEDLFAKGCQNVVLQRGVPRATIAGTSQIAGHGLYAGEFMPKNSYIDEYVGELISHGEAERRGVIYDHNFVSFLFDLNNGWVLDGHYLGNKTRFINHASSPDNGQNCQAKILWVNGEHRIKFFALRDIDAGEELLFDYGKEFAAKHGLNQTLPKTKALSKKAKGTEVKSDGRSKTRTRGAVASRGGQASTKRARKHQFINVAVDEDEDPQEAERQRMLLEEAEDDEEDYQDVGAADGRLRCVCPDCGKWYTRIDNLRTHRANLHGIHA